MFDNPLTLLGRPLLPIAAMQRPCVGTVCVGQLHPPEVQTQSPHWQRLMMSGQDGVGQSITACVTVATLKALTGRFRVSTPTLDALGGLTREAGDAV